MQSVSCSIELRLAAAIGCGNEPSVVVGDAREILFRDNMDWILKEECRWSEGTERGPHP